LKSDFPLAIGTPNRLCKLIEVGALSLSKTKVVLIDMKKNVKGSNILTMPDVKKDFYELLTSGIVPEVSHIKLALVE